MVDPQNITDYSRSRRELEEFLIFSIAVAGKTASTIVTKTHTFLENVCDSVTLPFDAISQLGRDELEQELRRVKMGKYTTILNAFEYLSNNYIDLASTTPEELEKVPGVGMKTSRFYIMHTQKNPPPMAALDTHILKWLGTEYNDVPKNTPSSTKSYTLWEKRFIDKAAKYDLPLSDVDLRIWVYYNNKLYKDGIHIDDFILSGGFSGPLESFSSNS